MRQVGYAMLIKSSICWLILTQEHDKKGNIMVVPAVACSLFHRGCSKRGATMILPQERVSISEIIKSKCFAYYVWNWLWEYDEIVKTRFSKYKFLST